MQIHNDTLFRIALTQISGIGPVTSKLLYEYFGSAEKIFSAPNTKLMKVPQIGEKTAKLIKEFSDYKIAEQEIKFIEKHKIKPLFFTDEKFPQRLTNSYAHPLMLYYLGNADLNTTRIVAIVGTRTATPYGKDWTTQIINDLAIYNCMVVSGLAFGIDVIAHKKSLENGLNTVGVMGGGLKNIYPSQHKSIAKKMVEQGGLLTEYLSDVIPNKNNFPDRNRIVAGMCDALIVVETRRKGGSMITAEYAFQMNRDVYALPGRAGEETSEGTNFLIKSNKAALVENAADVAFLSGWVDDKNSKKITQQKLFIPTSETEKKVVDFLHENGKKSIDDLSFGLNIPQHHLTLTLLDLELRNVIRNLPGKMYEKV